MSEDQTAPVKKQQTPLQEKIARRARKVAEAEGLEWKSLPLERRKEIRTAVRLELKEKRSARKSQDTE